MRSNFDLLFDFFQKKKFPKKMSVSEVKNLILSIFGAFQATVDRPYLPINALFYCDVVAFLDLFLCDSEWAQLHWKPPSLAAEMPLKKRLNKRKWLSAQGSAWSIKKIEVIEISGRATGWFLLGYKSRQIDWDIECQSRRKCCFSRFFRRYSHFDTMNGCLPDSEWTQDSQPTSVRSESDQL